MPRILDDEVLLAEAAAAEIVGRLGESIEERGRARFVLTGGTTPRGLYRRLAEEPYRARLDWTRVEFFYGDERCVPPTSEHSNHRWAAECLLDPIGARAESVHRMRGELGGEAAAREYEELLRRAFPDGRARFDLLLLGMGADGHVASLFPGSPALDERARLVVASEAPAEPRARVSLTYPALNAARSVLFLVSGAEKARAVGAVFAGGGAVPPAARVRPAEGELVWMLDRSAAAELEGEP